MLERFIPGKRMGFDNGSLLRIQLTGLVQNSKRNFGFAEIMKDSRRVQSFEVRSGQTEAETKINSYSGDQQKC